MSGWIRVSNLIEHFCWSSLTTPRAPGRGVKAALMSPDRGCAPVSSLRACSGAVWGRAGLFSGWDARRGAPPIAELLASIATTQTARKRTCPSGWDEIGRFAHQFPCMGVSPCGGPWRSTHPDCVPTRPHTAPEQALASLRLYPAPSGNRRVGAPTVAREHRHGLVGAGGLQSEVKGEGWRSQTGGHERRRPPALTKPARSQRAI